MEEKTVFVIFETDQWLSKDSRRLSAVCSSFEHVGLVVKDILMEYGMKHEEDIPEDNPDEESIESVLDELADQFQYRADNFGILIEEVTLNKLPYKL